MLVLPTLCYVGSINVGRANSSSCVALGRVDRLTPVPRDVWALGGVIVFGAFTSQLDTSVVNVGVDSIARELSAPLEQVQWVTNAYLLALAVALPITGWLGRRVGVGRLWLGSMAAFTVASGLCALAPSLSALIALRVLQGLAAGTLVPAGQTILGQAAGPQRLGRVMGVLGIAVSLAPAIGPVTGAFVLQAGSWRWLFAINLPIGALGLLLGTRVVPRGDAGDEPRLDVVGLVLMSTGLPLAVFAFTRATEQATPLTPSVLAPLGVAVAALAGFGRRAVRVAHPLLDLGLYRQSAYRAATAGVAFTGAALFGAGLLFPLFFELGRHQDVFDSGLQLISLGAGTALMSPLSGRITDRHGAGTAALIGSALTLATTLPFALLPIDTSGAILQPLLFLRGLAAALAVTPVGTAAYAAVAPEQLPDATTQVNLVQRLAGAIAGSVFAVLVARNLPAGSQAAFHIAFASLTGASVLSLAASAWLWCASRRPSPNAASSAHATATPQGDSA